MRHLKDNIARELSLRAAGRQEVGDKIVAWYLGCYHHS